MDPMRTVVARVLREDPGSSTRRIAVRLAVDDSTADYHLRRLRREGKAFAERFGRELAWFAGGAGFCPVLRRALPAYQRESVASAAAALDDRPRTASDIARRAGLTVGEVRWALGLLAPSGIVARTKTGRVSLHPEADVCMVKAIARERCERWGTCALSQRWPQASTSST